jgi:parvulin-like peptidyl-prolyl isomerase
MKKSILWQFVAFSLTVMIALAAPQAHAQNLMGGGIELPGNASEQDKKEYAAFEMKAQKISLKYKPQFDVIEKKYKPEITALVNKYKRMSDAIRKEVAALPPEDQMGPKGMAIAQKNIGLQQQMKAEPVYKKYIAELKPIMKKMGNDFLAVAPAKFKPLVQRRLDFAMIELGG